MYQFSFFRGFRAQREALLASTEQAALPFSVELSKTIEGLENPDSQEFVTPRTRFGVLWYGFRSIRRILTRSIIWRAVSALVVLGGVVVSTRIIHPDQRLEISLLFASAFLLSKIVDSTIEYFDATRRAQINRTVQAELMRLVNRKLLDINPDSLRMFSKGELKTLVSSDVEAIEDFITGVVQQVVPALVIILVLGPAIIYISGTPGVVALIAAILVLPCSVFGAWAMEHFHSRGQAQQDLLSSRIGEWVRNIRLVRFLGWNDFFERQTNTIMNRFSLLFGIRHGIACIVYGLTTSWWMVPILVMLGYAEYVGRDLSLIQLFSSIWILDHLMSYLAHMTHSLSMYGSASASAERLRRLWAAPTLSSSLTDFASSQDVDRTKGIKPARIIARNITISIDGKDLLKDISIDLDLSQRTAIVGAVGAGKTLFLESVVGERPLNKGDISVIFTDDLGSETKLPLWSKSGYEVFRSNVAYAPQQPFLSNALVRYNIDLSAGADDKTSDAVRKAVHQAQLETDILSFRKGLDEEVGETGINLSGGQKQRVSLARAFISRRPLLVLDDPLSAVDRDTEQNLMREILNSQKGFILVSHRLDELSHCDRILVMDRGRIVEDGTPADLSSRAGSRFSELLLAGELS